MVDSTPEQFPDAYAITPFADVRGRVIEEHRKYVNGMPDMFSPPLRFFSFRPTDAHNNPAPFMCKIKLEPYATINEAFAHLDAEMEQKGRAAVEEQVNAMKQAARRASLSNLGGLNGG